MPVFNAEKYLVESVESVLNQSLKDLEIIIIDDKSPDRSGEIADNLARKDNRIKVVHMPVNKGPGIARNIALDMADGDYCTFIDSDDKIDPEMYSTLVNYGLENHLDIVRCEMGRFSDAKPEPTPVFQRYGDYRIFREKSDLRQMALCVFATPVRPEDRNLNFGGSACSAVFHRSLFENGGVRFYNHEHMISEDYIFCYQTLLKARSVGLVPKSMYFYRVNPKSRSNIPRQDILDRALYTANLMLRMIEKDGFPIRDRIYAMHYVIDIIRAFVKNFFLADMPLSEKKKWFYSQQVNPILTICRNEFPLHLLPPLHRMHFLAFYNKKFNLLYALVKGREVVRSIRH